MEQRTAAQVVVALGGNIGNSQATFIAALRWLGNHPTLKLKHVSRLFCTSPVGDIVQADFLNAAALFDVTCEPLELLEILHQAERLAGRAAAHERWGPRELDLDIICWETLELETSRLRIPHARFRTRGFVLEPLCDIDPDWIDPLSGQSAKELLNAWRRSAGAIEDQISVASALWFGWPQISASVDRQAQADFR